MKRIIISFVLVFGLGAGLATLPACPHVGPVIGAVIDCLGSNRSQIDDLLNEFRPLLSGGSISWPAVKERAKQAGADVGGCFIMELTQLYLSGTKTPGDAADARNAAESFRKEVAKGATFKTMCVREDGAKQECRL